jgi:hydrogenase/urease accessory protein HupE
VNRLVAPMLGVLLWMDAPAAAHEVRPAYLELVQVGEATYQTTWKLPMRGNAVLKLAPRFPADCRQASSTTAVRGGAQVVRATVTCDRTLSGRTIRIDGLSATMVDVLVRVELRSGDEQSVLLRGGVDALEVARTPTRSEVFGSYLGLGVEHILLGIDHLLFVFALLLLVREPRPLVLAITAFTVAHSVTLGLATLGVLNVPQAPVEAVIALSIVLLAVELVRQEPAGWTLRRPWLVAFAVGLLHGLGFAGALSDVGLPASEIPLALLSFNLGVEAGQLAFVLAALLCFAMGQRMLPKVPAWLPRLAAETIGIVAAFWVVERTLAFL